MRFRLVASCKSFSPGTTNKQTNKQQIERQSERVTEREREGERDRERQAQGNSFVCFRAQNQQPLHTLRRKIKPRHQGASPISTSVTPFTPAQPQLQQYQAAAIPSVPWHMGAPRRWHRTSMSPKTETKKLHTQIHISYSKL